MAEQRMLTSKKDILLQKLGTTEFNVKEALQVLQMRQQWMWSWAARNFKNYENKALFFNVSGRHFNGYVIITYVYDTYIVSFASTQWNLKETIENVYVDCLSELIDTKVERIVEYKR